jgi:hypothetical protein
MHREGKACSRSQLISGRTKLGQTQCGEVRQRAGTPNRSKLHASVAT